MAELVMVLQDLLLELLQDLPQEDMECTNYIDQTIMELDTVQKDDRESQHEIEAENQTVALLFLSDL